MISRHTEWGSHNRDTSKPLDSKPRFPRGFVFYGSESDQQEFTGIPAGILAGFLARIPAGFGTERSTK